MVPNTFEGVTLKGTVGFAEYQVGYLVDLQGTSKPSYQIRLILNYEIPLP